ncbi:MAG: MFS transporter [Bacillota bacterium]|nr:MFS transporter [Bacillota bacterium]
MKNNFRTIALIYTFSYMAIGSFTPLIAQYLSVLGFSGSHIGIITSSGTAMAIFAVAFWGGVFSRRQGIRRKALLLACLCTGSAGAALCLNHAHGFLPVLLLFCLIYFLQPPAISLVDSLTVLSDGSESDRGFGSKRAWGAVGFALGVLIGGHAADLIGESSIIYIYITCFLITALVLYLMSRSDQGACCAHLPEQNVPDEERTDGSYRQLLRDKKVLQLLLCMFFMGGTNVANNTYFSFLYIEGGGTLAGVGIVMLLMVGSEVPFMMWCDRLAARFTLQKTILAAMIISSARFIFYGTGLPWWLQACMFFTQGAVNGIILVEFVRYISRIAPPGCKSLAISAYYIIGSNISTIACQFIGGMILDSFGADGVYMFFGLFNLAGTVLYVLFGLYRPVEDVDSTAHPADPSVHPTDGTSFPADPTEKIK